nr:hypothetical protein [Tanacetum cinerariifolium]
MAPLPPYDQIHPWLRYHVDGYVEEIVHNFKQSMEMIFDRHGNRVHILDFKGLIQEMRQDLAMRLRMMDTGGDGHMVFASHAWRRLFGIRAPLVREFILEFLSTFWMSDTKMGLDVADILCFQLGDMAPLPPYDQIHPWLRYHVDGYVEEIVHNFKQSMEMIFDRHGNRVHILDFKGLIQEMRQDLAMRLRMMDTGGDGHMVFASHAWRRLFGIRAPLVREFILEFLSTFWMSDTKMGLDVADILCFQLGGVRRRMT